MPVRVGPRGRGPGGTEDPLDTGRSSPADAPHPENAYPFLDYLMEPEVIAAITNTVGQANGNAASLPYVAEAVHNNPSIYPSEEVYRRLTIDRSWSPEQMHSVNRV